MPYNFLCQWHWKNAQTSHVKNSQRLKKVHIRKRQEKKIAKKCKKIYWRMLEFIAKWAILHLFFPDSLNQVIQRWALFFGIIQQLRKDTTRGWVVGGLENGKLIVSKKNHRSVKLACSLTESVSNLLLGLYLVRFSPNFKIYTLFLAYFCP